MTGKRNPDAPEPDTRAHPGRRGRRKALGLAAAGALALGTAAVVVPTAFADDEPSGMDAATEALPVDQDALGLLQIGEVVELARTLTYADDTTVLEFSEPDASYVKVHFERLVLSGGDHLTVSSPDGAESYRYDQSMVGQWATSIDGDTAVVELHRGAANASEALGAAIDRVAYGYPEDVIDDLAADSSDRARPEESICGGGDDKKPTPCYATSHPDETASADPMARLLIDGTVLCTAFRVGQDNRLLTNHHCFSETWEAERTEVWFGYQCANCDGSGKTNPIKVGGSRVLATSKNLDYTLFSVDDFGSVKRFGSLELSTEAVGRGDAIYIPQHPAGRPAEIAMESSVDGGNCVVHRPVYDGYIAGSDIAYYCDTEFGSSGSPVLSRDTHRVVALHHFGGCPNSGVSAALIHDEIGHLIDGTERLEDAEDSPNTLTGLIGLTGLG